MSIDGQLCLDLNRLARVTPAARWIAVSWAQVVGPAVIAFVALLALRSRPFARNARSGGPAVLLFGIAAFGVAVGIGTVVQRTVPADAVAGVRQLVASSFAFRFPDAHSAAAAAVATVLALRRERWLGLVAIVIALIGAAVDASTGALYPSDALAGLAIGAGCGIALTALAGTLIRFLAAIGSIRLSPRAPAVSGMVRDGPAAHREPLAGTGAVRLLSDAQIRPGRSASTAVLGTGGATSEA